MPNKEDVIAVAKECYDPEIPVNIWDLGLIYDIDVEAEENTVNIRMSLTSQSCPAAQAIPDTLKAKLITKLGVKTVNIQMVFNPPWTPERISEEGKKKLGLVEE